MIFMVFIRKLEFYGIFFKLETFIYIKINKMKNELKENLHIYMIGFSNSIKKSNNKSKLIITQPVYEIHT